MSIQIKYRQGNTEYVRCEVEVSDKAIYRKELMTEEYVLLTFNTAKDTGLRKGDYIDTEFGRFRIVDIDKPKRNVGSDGGYYYEQKFHAPWERWRKRKLFYSRQRGSEKAWSMTQKPEYFMQIVIDNLLAAGFGEFAAVIDTDLTEMKLVQFDGDDIVSGLTKIAEAWESEWWIADDVIHLSKCEYGTPVGFEIGDLINDMERSDGQQNDYVTRLYAFGSTRNIPTNYRKSEDAESVIEAVVERRLKLPEGTDHVDAWPNLKDEDVVEGIAIFDEVYPRRTGEITSEVWSETYIDEVADDSKTDTELVEWNAYRFRDDGIKFKEDYILPDEELRITFQTGALAGMDFAVKFNPDGADESSTAAQVWEVVRNDTYGIDLPNDKFHPVKGDTYVLYGYDTRMVSELLIPKAEEELLEEAKKLVAKKSVDSSVYSCPTNPIRCAGYTERKGELVYNPMNEVDLDVGQCVELRNDIYFSDTEGYRISRVRAFEKRLDNRFNCTYEVGETASYSKSAELDEKVDSLTIQTSQVFQMGGGVYLIKRYDGTVPSDTNAYSAKRANAEFLHRNQPDVANGLIKFLAGLEVGYFSKGVEGGKFDSDGNLEAHAAVIRTLAQIATAYVQQLGTEKFVDGFTGEGYQIWKAIATNDWNMTIDRLTVRKVMTVYELLIQKIRSVGGQIVVSAGNGKIKAVEEHGDDYIITFEDVNTFVEGDLVRCQTFTGSAVKHYWVRVSSATSDAITVLKSEFTTALPEVGDECVLMGNTDNPLRQNCVSISATEDGQPRVDVLNGIKAKDPNFEGCLRARLGNLDGITDNYFPTDNQPHGDGLYADNVYLRGSFVLANGDDIKTRFELLEGRITSEITAVEKELHGYESYLYNSYFDDNMAGWETNNNAVFFTIGNKWIWANDKPLTSKGAYCGTMSDRNRTVLYIKSHYLMQRNTNFESHPVCEDTDTEGLKLPKQFYLSFYYRVLTPGKLTIQFEGADKTGYTAFDMMSVEQQLDATGEEYETFEATGLWNGTGDFKLAFTGEIYIYAVRLSLDRIADVEQKYRTLFEQTQNLIVLLTESYKTTTRKVEQLQSSISLMPNQILSTVRSEMTDLENGLKEAYESYIDQRADEITLAVTEISNGLLTAGINIKSGEMTFIANKLHFKDSEGHEQMLFEDGCLNAKAINVDNLKADQLRMYLPGRSEPTIEITPGAMGMLIRNEDDVVCQEFNGQEKTQGISDFFSEAGEGDLEMNTTGDSYTTTKSAFAISKAWHNPTPILVRISAGTLCASAYVGAFSWSGSSNELRPSGHSASATIRLYLSTYEDEACTKRISRQEIGATSATASNSGQSTSVDTGIIVDGTSSDGTSSGGTNINPTYPTIPTDQRVTINYPYNSSGYKVLELAGKSVKTTFGGWFRLELATIVSAATSNDGATASWGDKSASGNKKPISSSWNGDQYVSNFFANGFCLGASKTNYVMVYKTKQNGIYFVAENDTSGIRLTEAGLQKKDSNGNWTAL